MAQTIVFSAFYTVAIACWLVPAWGKGLNIVRDNQDYEGLFKYWAVRSAYILPAFLAMAWYYHNLMILAIGFLIQMQGLIYFVSGRLVTERHAVRVAEYVMGALLGVMLLLTVEQVQTKRSLFDSLYYGQPVIADELLRLNGAL